MIFCVFGVCFSTGVCFAQNSKSARKPSPGPQQQSSDSSKQPGYTKPILTLTLVDPDEPIVAWRNVRLECAVVSGNLRPGIGILAITISLPPAMALQGKGDKNEVDIDNAVGRLSEGEQVIYPPITVNAKRSSDIWSILFQTITFRPRKEVFVGTLRYQTIANQKIEETEAKLSVEVKANPTGMYCGALVGAFLSAVLTIVYPLKQHLDKPDHQNSENTFTARSVLQQLATRFLIGAVATLVAILLFQTTTDIKFPVSISVQDFYGGVLLGLFGMKVFEAISARLRT